MHRDVIRRVALDFILRLARGGMVYVSFVVDVTSVHFDDFPAHPSGFRIPTHVIAYLERLDHGCPKGSKEVPKVRRECRCRASRSIGQFLHTIA